MTVTQPIRVDYTTSDQISTRGNSDVYINPDSGLFVVCVNGMVVPLGILKKLEEASLSLGKFITNRLPAILDNRLSKINKQNYQHTYCQDLGPAWSTYIRSSSNVINIKVHL